jgi:uncharacterized protein
MRPMPALGPFPSCRRIAGAAFLVLALAPMMPARAEEGTILSFNERAEKTLARDRLQADLAVEASDTDAARLQAGINRRMAAALARAKADANIAVSSGGYTVYEDRSDKAAPRWRGRQGLHLESRDQAALLQLVGLLQADGLVLTGLAATLSREATRAAEDELTDEALHRMKDRAERIAAALGLRIARFRTIHVGNVAAPPLPVRMLAAAAPSNAPPPVLEPGESTIGVTVEAEIELTPPH